MSGAQANIPVLQKIAKERGLFLLEDCANVLAGASEAKRLELLGI